MHNSELDQNSKQLLYFAVNLLMIMAIFYYNDGLNFSSITLQLISYATLIIIGQYRFLLRFPNWFSRIFIFYLGLIVFSYSLTFYDIGDSVHEFTNGGFWPSIGGLLIRGFFFALVGHIGLIFLPAVISVNFMLRKYFF